MSRGTRRGSFKTAVILRRYEGVVMCVQLWNQSLTHIEAADPARPAFRRIVDATMKYFGDAPDVDYWSAPIDARYEYRIRGTRGSTKHLSVCVYRTTVQDRVAANLADEALGVNPDGTFERNSPTEGVFSAWWSER